MPDPLSEVIRLMRPRAVFSKGISGAGSWAVRYAEFGHPGFCAVTEGRCRLSVEGEAPVTLEEGDFVLLPATPAFTMSGFEPAPVQRIDPQSAPPPGGEVRYGRLSGPADLRQIGGWFLFDSPDAGLLVSLLPRMIHIRGAPRLAQMVRLLGDESARDDAGRDLILERLVEILLVEALRSAPTDAAGPGLLRGLADKRIAVALRGMHDGVSHSWTVEELARTAGMSRSAFFGRFSRTVGLPPMEYLVVWRMAVARKLLRGGTLGIDEVAARVGYGSASTFSTAFSRQTGQPPGRFMRAGAVAQARIT